MKFCLDEDLSDEVDATLRGLGIDAIGVRECGRNGLSDLAQLEFAASEERCLVACNRTDFLNLTTMLYARESPHAGVLVLPWALRTEGARQIASAIVEYDRRHPEGVFPYTFDYLSKVGAG